MKQKFALPDEAYSIVIKLVENYDRAGAELIDRAAEHLPEWLREPAIRYIVFKQKPKNRGLPISNCKIDRARHYLYMAIYAEYLLQKVQQFYAEHDAQTEGPGADAE